MPDEGTQAPADAGAAAETTAAESQPVEQTTVESGAEKTTQTASTGEKKTETPVVQESKPQSRRSAAFRIQQLSRENAELKKNQAPKPVEDGQGNEGGEAPPEAPDVGQEVKKHLEPIVNEFSKTADDGELKEFFTGDKKGDQKEYESKIREKWAMDQYKDLAASDLYKILSYDSAIAAAKTAAVEESLRANIDETESAAIITEQGGQENHRERRQDCGSFCSQFA